MFCSKDYIISIEPDLFHTNSYQRSADYWLIDTAKIDFLSNSYYTSFRVTEIVYLRGLLCMAGTKSRYETSYSALMERNTGSIRQYKTFPSLLATTAAIYIAC